MADKINKINVDIQIITSAALIKVMTFYNTCTIVNSYKNRDHSGLDV